VKQTFEEIMALDLYEHVSARRYERTPVREGYRNGYRGSYSFDFGWSD